MEGSFAERKKRQPQLTIEDKNGGIGTPLLATQVTGDTTYGTIKNIRAVEDEQIRSYVSLPDWDHTTGYYGSSKFIYDNERSIRYLVKKTCY